jgi:hypothetical protein
MAVTTNLGITLLEVASAGKEVQINTAWNVIDAFLGNPIFDAAAPVTTERALVSIGSGGWTGGAGHFTGNAAGTLLGLNAPSGFTGDLMIAQLNGENRFVLEDTGALSLVGGMSITRTDAGTNNVVGVLTGTHNTSGTAAAGFGVQYQSFLEDAAGTPREAATIQARITDATAGTWGTNIGFLVYRSAVLGEPLTVRSVGTAPGEVRVQGDFNHATAAGQVGFFGVTKVSRQSVGAAATDPATTQTLVNNIRTALVNYGLAQT